MPNWQSTIFDRFSRLSRPRATGTIADIGRIAPSIQFSVRPFRGRANRCRVRTCPARPRERRMGARTQRRCASRSSSISTAAAMSPVRRKPIAALVARLCTAAQANAFSVAYRLAPEFAFPAGLRDGIDAYRHLLQRGFSPSQIVLAGDGAGGGLAFACRSPSAMRDSRCRRRRRDESLGGSVAQRLVDAAERAKTMRRCRGIAVH